MIIVDKFKMYTSKALALSGTFDLHQLFGEQEFLILTYHMVIDSVAAKISRRRGLVIEKNSFDDQMSFLSKHANVISLREVLRKIDANEKFDKNTVVITFDDGYKNNYKSAYPILKKYNFPATIFLVTGPIDHRGYLWWDRVDNIITSIWDLDDFSEVILRSPLAAFSVNRGNNCLNSYTNIIVDSIKKMPHSQRNSILEDLFVWSCAQGIAELESPMLTWAMIKEMSENNFSFECHTVNHAFLDELSLEEILRETVPARDRIREMTGQPGNILSCPNGNIPNDKLDALKEEFIANCSTCIGINKAGDDVYRLKRKDANYFLLNDKHFDDYFALEMFGVLDRPRRFKWKIKQQLDWFLSKKHLL